jgi:hypothetical protein
MQMTTTQALVSSKEVAAGLISRHVLVAIASSAAALGQRIQREVGEYTGAVGSSMRPNCGTCGAASLRLPQSLQFVMFGHNALLSRSSLPGALEGG